MSVYAAARHEANKYSISIKENRAGKSYLCRCRRKKIVAPPVTQTRVR